MRRESGKDREAWTAFVEGRPAKKAPKFGNRDRRKEGGYQSDKEADYATRLNALFRAGKIKALREQVPVLLVQGSSGIKGIVWKADFVYEDLDGHVHYLDAKGCKTQVYLLKKKLARLLLGIIIEEV